MLLGIINNNCVNRNTTEQQVDKERYTMLLQTSKKVDLLAKYDLKTIKVFGRSFHWAEQNVTKTILSFQEFLAC